MLVLPLPVRVLINSLDYMIDTFMIAIYLSECSTYTLLLLFISSRIFSDKLISRNPIVIYTFVLFMDTLVIGRHIFKDYNDYGIIIDFFGKGKSSKWYIFNFDICILIFQFLKFFTVYNYTTLAIANHCPSTVAKVLEDYGEPDYGLQYISVRSDIDDDDDINNNNKNKNRKTDENESKREDNLEDEDAIHPVNDNKKKNKQHHYKYELKRSIFDKIFHKRKNNNISDNDESALLIEDGKDRLNADDQSSNEDELSNYSGLDEEESLQNLNENNNSLQVSSSFNNIPKSKSNKEISSNNNKNNEDDNNNKNNEDNNNNNNNNSIIIDFDNSNTNSHNNNNNNNSGCSSSNVNSSDNNINNNYNNNNDNNNDDNNNDDNNNNNNNNNDDDDDNNNNNNKSKDKGKSPYQPKSSNKSSNKGKGKEEDNDQDDIFFDAFDDDDYISSPSSLSASSISSINANGISLHRIPSSSSSTPIHPPRRHPINTSLLSSSLSLNHLINYNNNNNSNNQSSSSNTSSPPEIDERLRTTEGNDNALLYLESYYQYLPVMKIKIKEALHLMKAIKDSNKRARIRQLQQRQEQEQKQKQEQEQKQKQEQEKNQEQNQTQSNSEPSPTPNSNRNFII